MAPKGSANKSRKRKVEHEPSGQRTLLSLLPYNKNSDQHNRLTELVTNYIVSGIVPIYTVQKDSFIKLLKGFDPRYQCPGRNFFTKTAIPERYQLEKTTLTNILNNTPFISCTADGWSSLAKDPYMSLTVHYVDSKWAVTSKCLATTYLPESHTGVNISNFVTETLNEYNVPKEKVVSLTTDSAANMIAACTKLSVTRISCFGHILHNAITKTLNSSKPISDLSVAARKIVSIFSYSFLYKKKLQKLQKDLNLPDNKITNDVATRWGSKLKMFSSLKSQMPGIDNLFVDGGWYCFFAVLYNYIFYFTFRCQQHIIMFMFIFIYVLDRKYRDLLLTFEQKDLLNVVVEALEPYGHLTDLLSGEKVVTVSSVAPMLIHLQGLTEGLTESNADVDLSLTPTVASLRGAIWEYIRSK